MSVTDSGNDAQLLRAPTKLTSGLLLGSGLLIAALQVQAADAVPEQEPATPAAQVAEPAASQQNAAVEAPAAPATEPSSSQDATTELDAVVVRAKPKIAKLKDVPKSISVVQGKDLERADAVDLGAITSRAGNVSWNLGNSRTSSISIRGIGKQAQTDAMDPSVGISVDGVAYAYNPLASFDFTDIDSVEVSRGPQGTQGGKNASLGLINVTTRRPSFTPEADVSLTLGQNNTVIARAAAGGPAIDNLLAWRGVFTVNRGDGAIQNKYNRDLSYKNRDNVSGRVSFLLTPSANFNALIKADLEPRHSEFYNGWVLYKPTPTKYANGATNTLSSDASVRLARRWFTQEGNYSYLADYLGDNPNLDNQAPLVTASRGSSAELNWTIGTLTLTSITAYKDYQFQARNDEGV
jgi:outer membrane receptor protein involved in Fe transport